MHLLGTSALILSLCVQVCQRNMRQCVGGLPRVPPPAQLRDQPRHARNGRQRDAAHVLADQDPRCGVAECIIAASLWRCSADAVQAHQACVLCQVRYLFDSQLQPQLCTDLLLRFISKLMSRLCCDCRLPLGHHAADALQLPGATRDAAGRPPLEQPQAGVCCSLMLKMLFSTRRTLPRR